MSWQPHQAEPRFPYRHPPVRSADLGAPTGESAVRPLLSPLPTPRSPSTHVTDATLDACGGLRGHRDADARHRRREHGPVAHRRGPRHGPLRPAVGRRRLHARAGQRRADGRLARRPPRPPPPLHHRPLDLHRRLRPLRPGDRHRLPQLRPRGPGHRRRDHVRGLAGAARPGVPVPEGARRRARRLRRHDRRVVRGRPADRRPAHERPRLAVDLPDQHPDRHRLPRHHRAGSWRSRATRPPTASTGPARSR